MEHLNQYDFKAKLKNVCSKFIICYRDIQMDGHGTMALNKVQIRVDLLYRQVLRHRSAFRKFVAYTTVLCVIIIVGLYKLIVTSNHPMSIQKKFIYIEPLKSYYRRTDISLNVKDWNNYELMQKERTRIGFGEFGLKTFIDGERTELEAEYIAANGHNALISDRISLDRALPELRTIECRKKLIMKDLPKVSVIMPFYDEHLSTLLRSIHSVINRAPPELLKEIILVNDASDKASLYGELEQHIDEQGWTKLVKIVSMRERSGIIWSRLAGARSSSAEILLFLDCHIEAEHNFLPPLIEPIAKDYRTVVIPTLDIIDKINYEVKPLDDGRTVFDWNFHSQRIPLRPKDQRSRSDPFRTPSMYGAAFAISAKFFWELQPDSGLKIFGADQLEMSFKINLCGGILLEAPCSRIAHVYHKFPRAKRLNNGTDFKAYNQKRVAEIWLDDYKKYLYSRHPERYNNIDIGDISAQLSLKENLNCKSFKYFLEEVAPDMLERFPLEEKEEFAYGAIRNLATNNSCIEVKELDAGRQKLILANCSRNMLQPIQFQFFLLRHYRDINIRGKSECFEGTEHNIDISRCHFEQGNQYFRFSLETLRIYFGPKRNRLCLDANIESKGVFINNCNSSKPTQRWIWGHIRTHAIKQWVTSGAKILDAQEIIDLSGPSQNVTENLKPK